MVAPAPIPSAGTLVGQTVLQYGVITLQRCLVRYFDQQPVLDAAGVALNRWKYTIHVTGYMIGLYNGSQFMSQGGLGSAAAGFVSTRYALVPRQSFQLATGCTGVTCSTGQMLLQAYPMQLDLSQIQGNQPWLGTVTLIDPFPRTLGSVTVATVTGLALQDVNDGPYCRDFRITNVYSDNVYKVEAEFEVCRIQCDATDSMNVNNTVGILSNRWASSDSIDVNLRTSRLYHGFLELASTKFNPHWFRQLIVPPLQPGFRRERMEFAASENGKMLAYTIHDISVACSAPYPATTWAVTQTNSSVMQDGGMKSTSQVNISLTAPENIDKSQLVQLGLYIMTAKIQGSVPGAAPIAQLQTLFWTDITITDFTGDVNRIDVSGAAWTPVQALADANGQAALGLSANIYGIGKIISALDIPQFGLNGVQQQAFGPVYEPTISNGGYPNQSPLYQGAQSLASIFYNYLQIPCDNNHAMNMTTNFDNGTDNNTFISKVTNFTKGNTPQVPAAAILVPTINPITAPAYSQSQQANMYTHWEMQSTYPTNSMNVSMPIALGPYSSGGADTRSATAIVQLTPPQTERIVRIRASRNGEWPEFPDPSKMGNGTYPGVASGATSAYPPITQTFLSRKLLGHSKKPSVAGGALRYTAECEYRFALSRAPLPDEPMIIGSNAWQLNSATITDSVLTNSNTIV